VVALRTRRNADRPKPDKHEKRYRKKLDCITLALVVCFVH